MANTGEIIAKAIIATLIDHTFQLYKFKLLINYQPVLSIIFWANGASSASFSTANLSSLNSPQEKSSALISVDGLTGYS